MTNKSLCLVAAAALTDKAGRVLVQQRQGGSLSGLWEFPGGKVEIGETPEAALIRELDEELAINVALDEPLPVAFASTPVDGRHLILLLYRVRRWIGEPRPLAASALAWHPVEDLADLPMPNPDQPLVAALIAASPKR